MIMMMMLIQKMQTTYIILGHYTITAGQLSFYHYPSKKPKRYKLGVAAVKRLPVHQP